MAAPNEIQSFSKKVMPKATETGSSSKKAPPMKAGPESFPIFVEQVIGHVHPALTEFGVAAAEAAFALIGRHLDNFDEDVLTFRFTEGDLSYQVDVVRGEK